MSFVCIASDNIGFQAEMKDNTVRIVMQARPITNRTYCSPQGGGSGQGWGKLTQSQLLRTQGVSHAKQWLHATRRTAQTRAREDPANRTPNALCAL